MNDNTEEMLWKEESRKEPAPAEKKSRATGRVIALALCCVILGGVAGIGGSLLVNALKGKDAAAPCPEPDDTAQATTLFTGKRDAAILNVVQIETGKALTAAEVYAANVSSTVGITTEVTTNLFGYQTVSAASGSGFIITADGYVLTNYHVIENSQKITVTTYGGESYAAELVGYDESNDIAVLKVDAKDLAPVVVGDSQKLNVGDDVIAIGNPLGELTFSLTKGVVSALEREVTLSANVTMDLIQTDCAINSGNSGGALFNMYGEVVGITNAKYSGDALSQASVDNIGFAIPMNSVISIVESIIEKGYVSKPYIGVSISDVDENMQALGLPAGTAIAVVDEDSPAEKAGLQKSDIVTAVNGNEIKDGDGLRDAVKNAAVGDVLTLTVYRQGETLELKVTVGEKIQTALANEEAAAQQPQQPMPQQPDFRDFFNQFVIPWNFAYAG